MREGVRVRKNIVEICLSGSEKGRVGRWRVILIACRMHV